MAMAMRAMVLTFAVERVQVVRSGYAGDDGAGMGERGDDGSQAWEADVSGQPPCRV
jgi:glycine cleavage system aminomethyltransferase T